MVAYDTPLQRSAGAAPVVDGPGRRLTSRIAYATAMLALTIATVFTIFDLAMRTVDQVYIDRALLTPPTQADITFGRHRLSFPGDWLTSPLALEDEMVTSASIQLPYNKLLSLIGASSHVDDADGQNDKSIVIRLQFPTALPQGVNLLDSVYLPKSAALPATGPSGLTMRRFLNKSGYDGEILYHGREGDRVFYARCLTTPPTDEPVTVQRPCIHVHAVSDELEAVIQFEEPLLADWRQLGSLTDALVRSITVR